MIDYIKGADVSTLLEVEACGGKFYDHGNQKDCLEILKDYGFNYVRLRIWNDPYSTEGVPYGAGTNDLKVTTALAKRAKSLGMGFLLDFHYSDFWTDPGKQIVPKAWKREKVEADLGHTLSDDDYIAYLEKAVHDFTHDTIEALKAEDVAPTMVQVGNEITNGLLWPFGQKPAYDNIARFVSAGIRAVKEALPQIPIMIHLDNGGNHEMYLDWFDNYCKRGEDFDIIGLSYYPFWHGTLQDLKTNMDDICIRYNKQLIVAEVSMGYTMEDYAEYEKLGPSERKGMATRQELVDKIEHPMTVEGQCAFLKDFLKVVEDVPEERGRGFFYWEPGWIPVPGSGWATYEALAFTGEKGPLGNEWANQALFDYDGNALPSLQIIKEYHK